MRCFTLSFEGRARPYLVQIRKRLREALLQLVETFDGAIVGGSRRALRHIRRDHEHDLFAHMIEGQHFVEEKHDRVGNVQLVFCEGGQALDLAHRIVSEKAHSAGRKRGQPRQARGFVAAERVAKHGEDVALNMGSLAAFGDGDLAPARHNALERREADEGVAAHLLAAFNRFQQKALALRPRRAQKGRDRRFQVGHQGAANGHKGVRPGEGQKFFAAGLGGSRCGFHSFIVAARAQSPILAIRTIFLRGGTKFRIRGATAAARYGDRYDNRR